MMPENSVDSFAFWCVLSIFAVIVGNLVYETTQEGRCEGHNKKGDRCKRYSPCSINGLIFAMPHPNALRLVAKKNSLNLK